MNKQIVFRFLFLFLICVQVRLVSAQDAKVDIAKINEVYTSMSGYSADVNYKVFESHASNKVVEEQEGRICRSGLKFYYRVGAIEQIHNKNVSLVVDNDSKYLLLGTNKSAANKDIFKQQIPNLDSAMRICEKVEFKDLGGGKGKYIFSISSKVLPYKKLEIEFDRKSYLLSKVAIYYSKAAAVEGAPLTPPRLEISFINVKTNPTFSKEQFSIAQYVRKDGNKYSTTPKFAKYTLIQN